MKKKENLAKTTLSVLCYELVLVIVRETEKDHREGSADRTNYVETRNIHSASRARSNKTVKRHRVIASILSRRGLCRFNSSGFVDFKSRVV